MKSKPDLPPDTTPHGRLDEGDLGRVLGYQLAQASVLTAQVFAAVIDADIDLRPVEYTTLALIRANPGLTASQLASALAVTPPNITMWLDRLEGRGLVERERSATDRRTQHITATPAGVDLADRATRRLIDGEQAALGSLSPGERAMMVELLHKAARCRRKGSSSAAGRGPASSAAATAVASSSSSPPSASPAGSPSTGRPGGRAPARAAR